MTTNREELNEKSTNLLLYILLICFMITTVWFYLGSIFLSSKGKMVYPRYIPENKWVGNDFFLDYKFAHTYFVKHESAYISNDPENWYLQNAYPPLFTFFLGPIFLFDINWQYWYRGIYYLILLFFISFSFVLPYFYHRSLKIPQSILFIVATGLVSYGVQFALERGQFDIISVGICLTSIYIFWYLPRLRWLAYILFFIAFQFKIYPYLFIICFIEWSKGWKINLIRVGSITGAIILSLFVMGIKGFFEFLRALSFQTKGGVYSRDHGINFGVDYLLGVNNINWTTSGVWALKGVLVLIGAVALVVVFISYIKNLPSGGFFPPLIFACIVSTMVLFPASKDYKLPLLAGGFGVYFIYLGKSMYGLSKIWKAVTFGLFGAVSFAYCTTLFSYAYRPLEMQNSFPFVYSILLCIPIIEVVLNQKRSATQYQIA